MENGEWRIENLLDVYVTLEILHSPFSILHFKAQVGSPAAASHNSYHSSWVNSIESAFSEPFTLSILLVPNTEIIPDGCLSKMTIIYD